MIKHLILYGTIVLTTVGPFFFLDGSVDLLSYILFVFSIVLFVASVVREQLLLSFFNAVNSFLIIYPHIFQFGQDVVFSRYSVQVEPLTWTAFWLYAVFLLLVNSAYNFTKFRNQISLAQTSWRLNSEVLAIIPAVICLSILVYWLGLEFFLLSRFEQQQREIVPEGVATFLSSMLRILPFWLTYFLIGERLFRGKQPFSIPVLIILLIGVFLANPYNAARFFSLSAILIAFFPLLQKMKLLKWIPILFPFLLLVILPLTSRLRFGIESVTWEELNQILYSLEFSALQVLNNGITHFRGFDEFFGHYVLSAIFIFIPRAWWPEKNLGTGVLIGEDSAYIYTNVGVPPFFDFYLDFGFLGVIVFSILVGFILKRCDGLIAGHLYTRNLISDLSILAFALLPIFSRGDLGTFMLALYVMIAAYLLMRLLLTVCFAVRFSEDRR